MLSHKEMLKAHSEQFTVYTNVKITQQRNAAVKLKMLYDYFNAYFVLLFFAHNFLLENTDDEL